VGGWKEQGKEETEKNQRRALGEQINGGSKVCPVERKLHILSQPGLTIKEGRGGKKLRGPFSPKKCANA